MGDPSVKSAGIFCCSSSRDAFGGGGRDEDWKWTVIFLSLLLEHFYMFTSQVSEGERKGERKSLFKPPLLVVRHRRCTRCDSRVAALNDCVVAELSAVQSQSAMGGWEWHNIITAQDGGIIITSYRTSDAGIVIFSVFYWIQVWKWMKGNKTKKKKEKEEEWDGENSVRKVYF